MGSAVTERGVHGLAPLVEGVVSLMALGTARTSTTVAIAGKNTGAGSIDSFKLLPRRPFLETANTRTDSGSQEVFTDR